MSDSFETRFPQYLSSPLQVFWFEADELAIILGHELAHHALGHTGYVRSQIGRMLRWLSRLDELSCDRIANELTGDRAVSVRALTVLLIGPQLLPYLNPARLQQQAPG